MIASQNGERLLTNMVALIAAIEQERMFQIKCMLLREDIDIEYCDKYGKMALIKSTFMN